MTTRKKPTFEPDQLYRVEVSEVCKVNGLIIRPKTGGTLLGSAAAEIATKITAFEPVEA